MPAAAGVTLAIDGFWSGDAKPFGPLQLYVAPAMVDAVRFRVPPTHTGPSLPAAGAGGIALTVTMTVGAFVETQPLVSVTVSV